MQDLLKNILSNRRERVVAIDPGETTGICCFEGDQLIDARQLHTKDASDGTAQVDKYIEEFTPQFVVCEDYKVYAWKTKDHAWASLHTPRLIGAIEYMCSLKKIPVIKQMAQQAKGFCTDDKLKAWGLWQSGQRHSRDAIRHAIYFLLFNVAKAHVRSKIGDCHATSKDEAAS